MRQWWQQIIHDRSDRNIEARILIAGLTGASALYRVAIEFRRAAYATGLNPRSTLPCHVVCVGNLTLGGTGKTPLVGEIARRLMTRGKKIAILTRGYARARKNFRSGLVIPPHAPPDLSPFDFGDEPALLHRLVPQAPIVIGADRARSGKIAIRRFSADTLILDDGFQHFALARNADLVCVDSLRELSRERLFPRGYLREPFGALRRASAFLLTRCNLGSFADANEAFLRVIAPSRRIFRVDFVADELRAVGPADDKRAPDSLKGVNVAAFCGLAQPDSFYRSLRLLGARPVFTQNFPDHHDYSEADLRSLASEARQSGADILVTTDKDAIKLQTLRPCEFPLWSLGIRPDFGEEDSRFERLLSDLLDSALET